MIQVGRKEIVRSDMKPVIFYKDYMGSSLWELRKIRYYERFAKVCKICGAVKNVQLNHIKYGNYGNELDRDLVPLCGDHHQALHDKIGVRGNMHYQTEHFIQDMIEKWDAEHEDRVVKSSPRVAPSQSKMHLALVVEKIASPIWRVIYFVLRR